MSRKLPQPYIDVSKASADEIDEWTWRIVEYYFQSNFPRDDPNWKPEPLDPIILYIDINGYDDDDLRLEFINEIVSGTFLKDKNAQFWNSKDVYDDSLVLLRDVKAFLKWLALRT